MMVEERRSELLKMEGNGFNPREIVKELSSKYQVSERQIYHDFERRGIWQAAFQQYNKNERLIHKVINRYEQIYRHAAFGFLTATHPFHKIGYLNTMLRANEKLAESTVIPDMMQRLAEFEEKAKRGAFVP